MTGFEGLNYDANHESGNGIDLSFLEGKKVVKAGILDQKGMDRTSIVEGGFAIDYSDGHNVCRVVLGFTDLGMWVKWNGEVGKPNTDDILRFKIKSVYNALCDQEIQIEDKPLLRGYSFVGVDGEEVLFLSCSDLKVMGEEVSRHFMSHSRNTDDTIYDIAQWVWE